MTSSSEVALASDLSELIPEAWPIKILSQRRPNDVEAADVVEHQASTIVAKTENKFRPNMRGPRYHISRNVFA